MTLQRVVWRAPDACTLTVHDGGSPATVTATPVVTSNWFGTTVGLLHRTADSFGYWQSSNSCSLLSAWRVAQLLPRVKTLRGGTGYDSTLCGLVIALTGDRHEDRLRERAQDLGLTVAELEVELRRLNSLWPTATELCAMWDKLPASHQDGLSSTLRQAIAGHQVDGTPALINRIEVAELRLRTAAQQKEYEETLITAGLPLGESLRQLLLDLGITNLAYTRGLGEMFDPSHFAFDDLDRELMRELIGKRSYGGQIWLITTAKQPDDPSTHHRERGAGVTTYWSDFGVQGHPRVMLGGQALELVAARWDRVTERFVLTLRPLGRSDRDDSDDRQLSITELRARIGEDIGLGHPLPPGTTPAWLRTGWRRFTRRR